MPFNDFYKVRSMERFMNLNVNREDELQNIVVLAAETCQTPVAFLVFVNNGELKHHIITGELAPELVKEDCFWNITQHTEKVVVIDDVGSDERLSCHPSVNNHPNIKFYAGVPLIMHDGQNIGSLYVLGQEVKELSDRRRHMPELLSRQAVNMVEFELSLSIVKEQFLEAKVSENKLRSFFESSKSSHLLVGRNMEILTFNKTFRDMAAAVFDTPVTAGAPAINFIYPPYVEDFAEHVQLALNGQSVQHERLIELKGLAPMWAKISYNPTFDADGYIFGVSFNATDISQRKKSEQKILNQNETLRKIAYLQSHELRKPVATILGLMHLLKLEEITFDSSIMAMLEKTVLELDATIHEIVRSTETQTEYSADTSYQTLTG